MTAGAVEQPRRHELTVFVVLAFAISWAMHIPLALATLRSGDPTASTGARALAKAAITRASTD